jgi:hypothetical protein
MSNPVYTSMITKVRSRLRDLCLKSTVFVELSKNKVLVRSVSGTEEIVFQSKDRGKILSAINDVKSERIIKTL